MNCVLASFASVIRMRESLGLMKSSMLPERSRTIASATPFSFGFAHVIPSGHKKNELSMVIPVESFVLRTL